MTPVSMPTETGPYLDPVLTPSSLGLSLGHPVLGLLLTQAVHIVKFLQLLEIFASRQYVHVLVLQETVLHVAVKPLLEGIEEERDRVVNADVSVKLLGQGRDLLAFQATRNDVFEPGQVGVAV